MIVWRRESCHVDCCDTECADSCSFCTVSFLSGGRYDPSTNTWTPTSMGANVPAERYHHTAVWTGTEMIVWGGTNNYDHNSGGRYDSSTDTLTHTSADGDGHAARDLHGTA